MTLIYAAHAAGRGILALKLIWGQMHPEHAAGFFSKYHPRNFIDQARKDELNFAYHPDASRVKPFWTSEVKGLSK